MKPDHTKTIENICPVCGYQFDCASRLAGKHVDPVPGDLSLCLKCGEVLVFQDDLITAQASVDDLMSLPKIQMACLERAQQLIRAKRLLDDKPKDTNER